MSYYRRGDEHRAGIPVLPSLLSTVILSCLSAHPSVSHTMSLGAKKQGIDGDEERKACKKVGPGGIKKQE